jgi:hypothetical protein
MFLRFLLNPPPVQRTEEVLTLLRFLLWSLLELFLLLTAIISMGQHALEEIPMVRPWLHPSPVFGAPSPRTHPTQTTPGNAPEDEDTDEPVPQRVNIRSGPRRIGVADTARKRFLPTFSTVIVTPAALPELAPPPVIDPAPSSCFELVISPESAPKPRQNAALRVIGKPIRGIKAIFRKIGASFRDNKPTSAEAMEER